MHVSSIILFHFKPHNKDISINKILIILIDAFCVFIELILIIERLTYQLINSSFTLFIIGYVALSLCAFFLNTVN